MIKVAITGNIGSGKTTVSKIFNVMGVPVFNADLEARLLYDQDNVKQILFHHFGERIFTNTKVVDTGKLAEIIFNDQSKLQLINGIIHPLVFEKYNQWLGQYAALDYTLHESAILFENNLERKYDMIIAVSAPEAMRLSRIAERDKVSKEKVKERMANQLSDKEKNKRSDFIIVNDGCQLLIPQVLEIDKKIRTKQWKELR